MSYVLKRQLFYWIFVPLVQVELDNFQLWWNCHHIRPQTDKVMPSRHVPNVLFSDPNSSGGEDLGIKIDLEVLQALKQHLEDEKGSRDQHLSFTSNEFAEIASGARVELGLPPSSWKNSWDHFAKIATHLGKMLV